MHTTAIILAGGKSKRMGTDKALLKLDGHTLLKRQIERVKPLCSDIIISSNDEAHKKFAYPVYEDETPNCGPMGGIYSCLKHSKNDWNFVISVDAAYVESSFIEFLISETEDFDAIVPYSTKGKEPLIAMYNKSSLLMLEKKLTLEDFKMHNLLQVINTKFVNAKKWVDKYPRLFHNLNSPSDLCS